jgi:hypothetical protein
MWFVVGPIFRFVVRPVLTWVAILLVALVGVAAAVLFALRREQSRWGIDAADAIRVMPGDDLVAGANIVDTRSLRIDAAPGQVWPWLAQLGYGRGGWYSYDAIDMKGRSAEGILPEHQDLSEGDLVPTHPGGGFEARVVEPGRALVLYLDDDIVREQAEGIRAGSAGAAGVKAAKHEPLTPGLQAAGAMSGFAMPAFRASWAFLLEPEAGGTHTRLIERFRVFAPDGGAPARLGMPVMGLGVFAMTRKHMLGLKSRAEGRRGRRRSSFVPDAAAAEPGA